MSINWGGPRWTPIVADYDGDGKADIGVYSDIGAANVLPGGWYILLSATNYTSSMAAYLGGESPYGYKIPVPGLDTDGDGKADITVYDKHTGEWDIRRWTSPTILRFIWGGLNASGLDATLVPGDYDGDGKSDAGLYFRGTGRWFIATSSSNYAGAIDVTLGGVDAAPVPDDYDGDGRTDPAVCERRPGVAGTWSVRKSSANFATVETLLDGFGDITDTLVTTAVPVVLDKSLRTADVDGDHRLDLTVYNPATDLNWFSLLSKIPPPPGNSTYTSTLATRAGGPGWSPAPGDFDGDGRGDRGLYEQSTGRWYVVLSGTNFTTSLSASAGGPGWKPVPADYDGDGKTDFGVYQATTGLWYILKSGSNYTALAISWGGGAYSALPADFDGDGRADLGVYIDRNWYVLLSGVNYTTSRWAYFGVGFPGPVGIASDYDADGYADPGFYNPANGEWYILFFNRAVPQMFNLQNFGGPDWVPMVGDLSGKGRANPIVYQTTTGKWKVAFWECCGAFTKDWGGPGYTATPQFP